MNNIFGPSTPGTQPELLPVMNGGDAPPPLPVLVLLGLQFGTWLLQALQLLPPCIAG